MLTLKEILLVKLAAGFVNDSDIREMINQSEEIWEKVIRKKISDSDIPSTLQGDIIDMIKPIESEVLNWMKDHHGIFKTEQEWSLKFCFNVDGTVNRVKTADLLIHSEGLDKQKRLALACLYWPLWYALNFLEDSHESPWEQILHKGSTANEDLYEENGIQCPDYCRYGLGIKANIRGWYSKYKNWNDVTLQSHHLDVLTEDEREALLEDAFKSSRWIHVHRFCLSRMSADHREFIIKRFPLKSLRTYLFWPYQRFFLDVANKVWDGLQANHFTCLLHIIICQKIVALWKDYDYVNLLREFWSKSPDHLKNCVKETGIFKVLMEILKNGFQLRDVPGNFLLHDSCLNKNIIICEEIIINMSREELLPVI